MLRRSHDELRQLLCRQSVQLPVLPLEGEVAFRFLSIQKTLAAAALFLLGLVEASAIGAAHPEGAVAVKVDYIVSAQDLSAKAFYCGRAEDLEKGRGVDSPQATQQRPLVGNVGQVLQIKRPGDYHQNPEALGGGGIMRHINSA